MSTTTTETLCPPIVDTSAGEASGSSATAPVSPGQVLRLKLKKSKSSDQKKVKFSEEVVDNENMGKKSSKCCCIYQKQRLFGGQSSESEDSDDDQTDHCFGHKKHSKPSMDHNINRFSTD